MPYLDVLPGRLSGDKMQTVVIRIYGIVQGVGFRPFVARTAEKHGIVGSVANKGSYVEILAEAEKSELDKFIGEIKNNPPERSAVLSVDVRDREEKLNSSRFEITESEKEYGDIFVSPDIAMCESCRRELFDPSDRRYLHPFINCTQCGPRLTILKSMPYDRERTSMGKFPMCEKCSQEYHSPLTRRYDAQPVCCNECGPQVFILGTDIKNSDAITLARREIMAGKIAAIKGIGGFHLCCDAKNPNAVQRLRRLKSRPMKPFALMMKDMDTVRRECIVEEGQEKYLDGWQKPVLLLAKRKNTSLCPDISPGNPTVGVMLPYAPLQQLLFDYPDGTEMSDCLVMTSANAKGAPICRCDEDAVKEISAFCDLILTHNRDILLRADDSVADWLFGKPYMIRRSRGFAPLPIMLENPGGHVLAVGGELKNTFCIGKNGLLYPSPYVGDMADIRTVTALGQSVDRMCELLETAPELAVCDLHPKYNTTVFAEEYAEKKDIPLVKIQHHYAHILSCMAENGCNEKVIGAAFDGTGFGTDGTVWGGEFLVCDYSGFERAGHIRPFTQAGGDASAREGWRIAVQLLYSALGDKAEDHCVRLGLCDRQTFRIQKAMADRNINCVSSTSCGRLFDGISAILGIRKASTFEGEASMALEFAAEEYLGSEPSAENDYTPAEKLLTVCGSGFELCTDILAVKITEAFLDGVSAGELALYFHCVLADMIKAGCERIRSDTGLGICALSGGVFQNRLLVRLTKQRLEAAGFRVLLHSLIPPNDGGIALGQAAYGLMNGLPGRS